MKHIKSDLVGMRSRAVSVIVLWGLAVVTGPPANGAAPVAPSFTFQGQLRANGVPVGETCDFWFSLWDAAEGGAQAGPTLAFDGLGTNPPPIDVVNGLFSVDLSFGSSAFSGQARWLEVVVACPTGHATLVVLTPRQPVTPAPYALYSVAGPGAGGFWAPSGDTIHNTNEGHVGIGTVEPTHPLHVEHDVTGRAIRANGTISVYRGLDEPGTGLFISRTTATVPFPIASTTQIDGNRVDASSTLNPAASLILNSASGGSVGIGTKSPGRKLHIGDNTIADSEGMIRLASRSGTQGSNRIWDVGVPETDADTSGAGYSFVIDDTQAGTDAELMIKYGSGYVGIGTIHPETRLDVAGTTRTTALEVDGGAIHVRGAGPNTSTAVFIHVPTMSNSRCDAVGNACHETTINHPFANGDPNAILFVTPSGTPRFESDSTQVHVRYDTDEQRWKIRTRWWDLPDLRFNVMIIKD
jgi:hypothetical protein